jgi:hypothetical protein
VTVLPPVFGPVMTSVSNSPPSETSIGTAVSFGSSGWRARRSCRCLSVSSGAMVHQLNVWMDHFRKLPAAQRLTGQDAIDYLTRCMRLL